jgi:group I intron endonuclease
MNKTIIYRITNRINGKVYIGQTIQGMKQRKAEHFHRFNLGERDHKIYRAFRKYGWEQFQFDVICSALDEQHLNSLEQHFITEYNCFNRGYNMTCGGDSVSQETRDKISAAQKGRKIPWIDKIMASRRKNNYGNVARSFEVLSPSGELCTGRNLKDFCIKNNLDVSNLYHTKDRPKACKGFTLVRTFND